MMLCAKPFRDGVLEYGCGQCRPCRLNRRRVWTSRLMLERDLHEASSFITLTYDEEHLPSGSNLAPKDLQDFLKRLRLLLAPLRVRFYAVGEYGDLTQRPHYHIALFGFYPLGHEGRECVSCEICRSWGKGHCDVGTLTEQSAAYVAGYVMNKLAHKEYVGICGLEPEFCRMSLRPGIGAGAVALLKDALVDSDGVIHSACDVDVPSVIRSGGKKYPLGRYLRARLRKSFGGDGREPDMANHLRQVEVIAKDFPQFDRIKHYKALKESRRLQSQRNAAVRAQIARSKKGIGI